MHVLGDCVSRIEVGRSVIGLDRSALAGEPGILKTSSVSTGRLRPEENKAVQATDQSLLRTTLHAGSILFNRSNTIQLVGASAYVEESNAALFLPDKLWALFPEDEIEARWLHAFLSLPQTRELLRVRASGSAAGMKNISVSAFRAIPLSPPPLDEQRKIAEILRTWDDAIDAAERDRQAREIAASSLASEHFEFVRATAEPLPLGGLFDERSETGHAGLPLMSVTRDNGVIRQSAVGRKDSSSSDRGRYKRVLPGDLTYNTMRMWQGASGLVREPGIVSPAYTVVVPRVEAIDPQYASHLFKDRRMIFDFQRYSQGLTSDTWNLKFPAFSKIRVSIPPLTTQAQVASAFDEMQVELALLDRRIELLKQQKRGLMQKLLSGEIRVNTDDEHNDEGVGA